MCRVGMIFAKLPKADLRYTARHVLGSALSKKVIDWLFRDVLTVTFCTATIPGQNVRFGSKADIAECETNVRFTPKSGHWLSGS